MQVNRISASVMMVSWTPLSLSEARGFITHYTVAYFPQQSSSKRQEPNPMYKNVSGSDSNQTTINGLEASIDYGTLQKKLCTMLVTVHETLVTRLTTKEIYELEEPTTGS